jgi:hypothetical protein
VQRLAAMSRLEGPEPLVPEHSRNDPAESIVILGDEDRRGALAALGGVGHIDPVSDGGKEKIRDLAPDDSKIMERCPRPKPGTRIRGTI